MRSARGFGLQDSSPTRSNGAGCSIASRKVCSCRSRAKRIPVDCAQINALQMKMHGVLALIQLRAVWRDALLVLAAAPLAYYVVATIAAWRFFRRVRTAVLPDYSPPVSLLKPVHGVDFGSYENFSSFCRQDYPDYEILFAVNDETDSAVPLIRRIIAEHPERRIRLVSGAEQLGANRKVNNLIAMARAAEHEILVLTDGDIRVDVNYLREVIAPFADRSTGAVTSFYRAIAERNLGAELEAIG